ncbi:MAG: prepilin-type N-terminal cleavage/methylation domain-containing protein [Chloroflexi bacterium]|nr:MAG: prepilin-type N-terminal cleavage/methylation domain-containing protein [Chloroflexota bacterium]TMD65287.1 MAG: prepilin-type N-terminal cleavage/methylation domain-containing protein [Chloroflexota bacterium]
MRTQRGFTLVEMMVALALLSIITVAMAGTFLVGYRAVSNEARVIAADEAVSGASVWLTRDLNSATALPAIPVTVNLASTLTVTYGSPPITVVYSVNNNHDLVRTVNLAATTAARGITSVTVTAAGCYATVTILPSATGATASTFNVSNRPGGCW